VLRNAREWGEMVHYSPDESLLAVGSHDNNIYIYDVEAKYSLRCKLVGHNSYITCLDWAEDNSYVRSNCGGYELLFFQIPEAKENKVKNNPYGASETKETQWASQNCKLGWAV